MIDSVSGSIVIGVLSGVLTSFLVWLLVLVFEKIVMPWYQKVVYRGVVIDGEWFLFYKKGEFEGQSTNAESVGTVLFTQRGHKILGEVYYNKNLNGSLCNKKFFIEGFLKDNHLVCTLEVKDPKKMGIGTYVMELVEDGNRLDGTHLFVNTLKGGNVSHVNFSMKRSE